MRRAGATMFNLSVLTADFYTLLAGLILFHYQFHYLYFVSFAIVMAGSIVYAIRDVGKRSEGPPPIARCLPNSACCWPFSLHSVGLKLSADWPRFYILENQSWLHSIWRWGWAYPWSGGEERRGLGWSEGEGGGIDIEPLGTSDFQNSGSSAS